MRPCSLLAPLGVGLLLAAAAPATAGTYAVAWDGADLHGRVQAVSQYAAGTVPRDRHAERRPHRGAARRGHRAGRLRRPLHRRAVRLALRHRHGRHRGVHRRGRDVRRVHRLVAHRDADAPRPPEPDVLEPQRHPDRRPAAADACSSAHAARAAPRPAYDTSSFELRSLHATLADDVAPSSLRSRSPSAGGVVGVPQVELSWSAARRPQRRRERAGRAGRRPRARDRRPARARRAPRDGAAHGRPGGRRRHGHRRPGRARPPRPARAGRGRRGQRRDQWLARGHLRAAAAHAGAAAA